MFNRTIRMLSSGVKPVFVFDGKPPTLKGGEVRVAGVCLIVACVHAGVCLRREMLHIKSWLNAARMIYPTTTAGEAPAEAGGGGGGAQDGQGRGCVRVLVSVRVNPSSCM